MISCICGIKKKMIQMNLFTKKEKKKRTHSQNRNRLTENNLRVARSWGGRMRRRDS